MVVHVPSRGPPFLWWFQRAICSLYRGESRVRVERVRLRNSVFCLPRVRRLVRRRGRPIQVLRCLFRQVGGLPKRNLVVRCVFHESFCRDRQDTWFVERINRRLGLRLVVALGVLLFCLFSLRPMFDHLFRVVVPRGGVSRRWGWGEV